MQLTPFSRNLLGLVADGKQVHLLHLRVRGRRCTLVDSIHIDQEPDERGLAAKVHRTLQEKGWLYYPCIYALQSSLVSVKILPIPHPQSDLQLQDLVESHIEDFESMSASHAVTEYMVSEHDSHQQLLICTAREDSLTRELRLPRAAGLNIVEILPHSLAHATGIQYRLPDSGSPRVFLYTGPEQSDWIISQGSLLMQVRAIHIRSEDLIEEQEKHPGSSSVPPPLFQQWLVELEGALRLFHLQYPSPDFHIHELVIDGYFIPSPQRIEAMETSLNLTIQPKGAPVTPPAAALGLALSGTRHRIFNISLLPPDMRIAAEQRLQFRYWIAACVLFLVSFLLYGIHVQRSHDWLQHTFSQTSDLVEQYENLNQEKQRYEEQIAKLQLKVLPLRAAQRNHDLVRRLLQSVYEAKDPEDWFIFLADADAYSSTASLPTRPAREGATLRRFILEGYTPVDDLSTVRAMIEHLRANAFVQSADLLPDDQIHHNRRAPETVEMPSARWFVLEIVLHDRRGR